MIQESEVIGAEATARSRLAHAVVVRRSGGSLRITIPRETLARLHVQEGDVLYALETDVGLLLTPYDDRVERHVTRWDGFVRRHRKELRQLGIDRTAEVGSAPSKARR